MKRLALGPGLMLKSVLSNYSMDLDDLNEVRDFTWTIQYTAGITARAKTMLIKKKALAFVSTLPWYSWYSQYLGFSDELLGLRSVKDHEKASIDHATAFINRNIPYNTAQLATLALKFSTYWVKDISGNAKEAVPIKNLYDYYFEYFKETAYGMPPTSKMGLRISSRLFINAVNMTKDANWAMFLQAEDARNIPTSNVVEQLEYMKNGFPTRQACYVLKDLYVNYSETEMLTQSEEEVFQLLTPSAIERMPICIIAAFGTNLLRRLDDVSKIILLDRLVTNRQQVLAYTSISRAALQTIVDEGLTAKGRPSVLTGADVNMYGEILLYFPTDLLYAVTTEGAPVALRLFNSLASSVLMPCLDGGRRAAIANLITKYKGDDPQTWRNMSGLCCLLYTLPSGTLSRIPRGALMSCRCPIANIIQYAPEDEARQVECRSDLGEDYEVEIWQRDNVRRVQAWAALDILDPYTIPGYKPPGRRKRAVSDVSLCNRAAVSGADDISNNELSSASSADIMQCLAALGDRYMDNTKAQILANKVRESLSTRSWSNLTNDLMGDMNFIMKGIPANEIRDLPSLSPNNSFYDTVTVLGNEKMKFTDDQLRAYADKVLTTWLPLANMTDVQLAMFNRLMCATNPFTISTLSDERVGYALAYLGVTLEGCSREDVLAPLALKAITSYTWPLSRAEVREMGVVFAGIEPRKIRILDSSSFAGVTPAAMRAMSSEAIKGMDPSQLRSLPPTTAMAMSPAIREKLWDEQKAALEEAMRGHEIGASCRRELSAAAALLGLLIIVFAT
ncbi:uncharacterized protein LOC108677510 [Hyalella azteca]|uniref:Uncharacterized protein LOC108677510 n=1 Tax=Hyalella azteca TaxID=294128 RepID=A0A8B7P509_HYAAZ|nr:uncharacterized protein LOC108677510 [Hyalella azteca]